MKNFKPLLILLISIFLFQSCHKESIEIEKDNYMNLHSALDSNDIGIDFQVDGATTAKIPLPWGDDSMLYNTVTVNVQIGVNKIDKVHFYFNDEFYNNFPARLDKSMFNSHIEYGMYLESECTYLPVEGSIRLHGFRIAFDVRFKSIHNTNCTADPFFLEGKFNF